MAKCIECGCEIADGQELCEHCASSQNSTSEIEEAYLDDLLSGLSDDFSLSEEELNNFDMNSIADIDLSDFGDVGITDINMEEIPIQEELDNLEMSNLSDLSEDLEIQMPELEETDDIPTIEMSQLEETDDIPTIEIPNSEEQDNAMQNDLLQKQVVTDVELAELPGFDDDDDEMEMLLQEFSSKPDDVNLETNLDMMPKEPTLVEMGLPSDEDDDEMDGLLDLLSEDIGLGGSKSGESRDDSSLFVLDDLVSDSMSSQDQDVNEEDAFESDLTDILQADSSNEKPKKSSLIEKLFGNVHDAKSQKKHEKMLSAEEKKELRKKEKAEKKAQEKALKEDPAYKAEQEAKKKQLAEKKAQEKALKEAKKKEKQEAKKKKKAELQAELEAEAKADQGRINPIGATIVFLCFGVFAGFVILGTKNFSYNQSVAKAKEYFGSRYYTEAYNEVRGVELKNEDIETYDRIVTVMYVNKQWNSYNNYYAMQMYPEALDSLLKGFQKYDEYITDGEQLGVVNDLDYVRGQIKKELKKVFSMSEKKAYSIINSSTQEEYSQKVIEASKVAE